MILQADAEAVGTTIIGSLEKHMPGASGVRSPRTIGGLVDGKADAVAGAVGKAGQPVAGPSPSHSSACPYVHYSSIFSLNGYHWRCPLSTLSKRSRPSIVRTTFKCLKWVVAK